MGPATHIYPEFARMLGRADKERLLRQRGVVLWLFGLSGSGKSTIANALERRLHAAGRLTQVLDGDNIRSGLNRDLGFTDAERLENIRRIAEVAKLYLHSGIVTLTSFITPRAELRALARQVIGEADFLPVYVHAAYETCAARDPKGLYQKVASGQVAHFTGRDSAFEAPQPGEGALWLDTEVQSLDACVDQLWALLQPRIHPPADAAAPAPLCP